MKLEELSAAELGRRIAARELTSRDVAEYFLDRIERLNGEVNAYVHVDRQAVLAEADSVDRRIAAGEAGLSPLAGVPVSLKDVLCVKDVPTTCGSRMLADFRPPYDATVVDKLRRAGLVLLGKTNMDEFAMGGSTETSIFGACKNPWDRTRTAGGSSGGAAACLAAGMVPLSIGSDTGGSVRQPAAFCGVLGLKPTYGRVSRYGLVAFASSLDQVGPLARNAEDLALLMEVISGHDERDSTSLAEPAEAYGKQLDSPLAGVRVGVIRSLIASHGVSAETRAAVERAADSLRELGATLVDVELPHADYAVATYYLIAPSEASSNLARYDGAHYGYRAQLAGSEASLEAMYCRTRSEGFGAEVQRRIMLGMFALSSGYIDDYYGQALRVRRMIYEDYRKAFESVDMILGPVAPSTAFRLGEKLSDPVQMYLEDLFTVGANLAGVPAIAIPAGLSSATDGVPPMPLSIQLQGPPLSESRLLSASHQLQQAGFFSPSLAPQF